MKEDLEPLDDDVMAVLRELGPVAPVAPEARDRVWNAVAARVAMTPSGGSGGGAPLPPRGATPSFVSRTPWLSVGAALLLGGAVGALARGGATERVASAPVVVSPPPARPSVPVEARAKEPWAEIAPPPPPASHLVPTPLPPNPAPLPSVGQTLAAESAILDIARTAIARGEGDHALAAVARHAAEFPRGSLREEREALAVKALVLEGRREDARARAARFRATYPESLFLPAIDSSLRSLP